MFSAHLFASNEVVDNNPSCYELIQDLLNDYWEDPSNTGFVIIDDHGRIAATLVTLGLNEVLSGFVAVTVYKDGEVITNTYAVTYAFSNGHYLETVIEPVSTPALV